MRLETLHLTRYGHFTDVTLPLPYPANGPDLHVIYGPNEAGKSTLFSAWLDLLFGIPPQSGYNFLHDYRAMRLGAEISTGQGRLGLARIKGTKGTLLDAATDQPLAETTLTAALGGLDRSAYRTMFSLDERSLVEGGETILSSQGELGELLFSASAGLEQMGDGLRAIAAEAEDWFKPRGRKHQLAEHKRALEALSAQRAEVDLRVSDWRALKAAHAEAEAAYRAAVEAKMATEMQRTGLMRDQQALRDLARLARLEARRAALAPVEDLPEAWHAQISRWQTEAAELAALLPEAAQALARVQAQAEALAPDPVAEGLEPQLEGLEQDFGAVLKERADLPRRMRAAEALDSDIMRLVQALGQPEVPAENVLLPEEICAEFGALIEADLVLRAREQAAAEAVERTARALPDNAPAEPLDRAALDRLSAMMRSLRQADGLRMAREAQAGEAEAEARRHAAMAALNPWRGDMQALAALDLPSDAALADLAARIAAQEAQTRELRARIAQLDAETRALRAGLGAAAAVDAATLSRLRRARDVAWQTHRAKLDAVTADLFEAAMQADDDGRVAELAQARESERLAQIARLKAQRDGLAQELDASLEAGAQLAEIAASLWPRIGLAPEGRSLADFTTFAARRAEALALERSRAEAEARAAAFEADLARAAKGLADMLAQLGQMPATESFEALMAEAEVVLENAASLQALAERQRAHRMALREQEDSANARQNWQDQWDRLCDIAEIDAQSPEQMRLMLRHLNDLAPLLKEAQALARRIGEMEGDIADFTARLAEMTEALGLATDTRLETLMEAIRTRLVSARETRARRAQLAREAREAEARLEALQARDARLQAALAPLTAHFAGAPLPEIARQLAAQSEARAVAEDAASLRDALRATLACDDLDPEIARLNALDPALIDAEIASLAPKLAALGKAQEAAYATLAEAEGKLGALGHDGAAARLDVTRAALIAQIGEEAQRHLARQAALVAIEQALRLYRDQHRSAMMARASEAFATLTDGRYTRLATQPEGPRETLIALMADGASKGVAALSEGTRFQLYLALRAAGHAEIGKSRPLVPFIADDILEKFDDARAARAFELLGEMGQRGQVIYLTHHAHLCEIARAAVTEVQVHVLSA